MRTGLTCNIMGTYCRFVVTGGFVDFRTGSIANISRWKRITLALTEVLEVFVLVLAES